MPQHTISKSQSQYVIELYFYFRDEKSYRSCGGVGVYYNFHSSVPLWNARAYRGKAGLAISGTAAPHTVLSDAFNQSLYSRVGLLTTDT